MATVQHVENVGQWVTFSFDDFTPAEGKYGPQLRYGIKDTHGEKGYMYADEGGQLAFGIHEAGGPSKGLQLFITRTKVGKVYGWKVQDDTGRDFAENWQPQSRAPDFKPAPAPGGRPAPGNGAPSAGPSSPPPQQGPPPQEEPPPRDQQQGLLPRPTSNGNGSWTLDEMADLYECCLVYSARIWSRAPLLDGQVPTTEDLRATTYSLYDKCMSKGIKAPCSTTEPEGAAAGRRDGTPF